jgi:recombination protein RecA
MTEAVAVRSRTRSAAPPQAVDDSAPDDDMDLTDEVITDEEPASQPAVFETLFDDTVAKKDKTEIGSVISQFGKQYGAHVIRRATQKARFLHIPTDIFTLDMGLHGGVPQSLISMVYGWESSGKTTTAMRVIAQTQRKYPDMVAVLIDTEGTYDADWGTKHGIDNERLVLVQPESGEQAVDLARALIKAKETSIVVLDSLPALMPMKEMEKAAEDAVVAMQARLIGRFVRTVSQALIDERQRKHYPSVLLINQFREKIAMMGDTRTLPGGNALKFFVSVRWEVKNKEVLGKDRFDSEVVDYNEHSWRITKNKVGNGLRNGEFVMIRNPDHAYGPGFIDDAKPVLTFARKFGLVSGGGSAWYMDGVNDLSGTKPLKFGKLQEMLDHLYSDLDYYEGLKRTLITTQRVNNGLSAEGWY